MQARRAARGRPRQQCACRGEPAQWGEVARAEDARGQGALGAECAEAWHAGAEVRGAGGGGRRRVRRPRGRDGRGVGAGGRAPDRARAAGRGRRLAHRPRRPHRGRAVRGASRRGRWARARPDPRRQRHPLVRDAPALSRRGAGRVLARAAHAQGAAGRAGDRDRSRPEGAAVEGASQGRPRRGHRSAIVGNRTNPGAAPRAPWTTS